MATLTTKIIKDGNSSAIRLSRPVLSMSGLSGELELEVTKGKIIISSSKRHPRTDWRQAIKQDLQAHGPLPTRDDYGDLQAQAEATLADGLQ